MEQQNQTVNPQAEVTPPPSVTSKNYLPFVLLGGVLLFAVVGSGAFLLGQKSSEKAVTAETDKTPAVVSPTAYQPDPATLVIDPTVNWKTYSNNNYKYEFKYPVNWYVDPNNGSEMLSDKPFIPNTYPDSIVNFSVDTPADYRLNIDAPIGATKELGVKVIESKIADLYIAGHKVGKFKIDVLEGSPTDAIPGTVYKIELGQKYLMIQHVDNMPEKKTAEINKIFDLIISSIKFL